MGLGRKKKSGNDLPPPPGLPPLPMPPAPGMPLPPLPAPPAPAAAPPAPPAPAPPAPAPPAPAAPTPLPAPPMPAPAVEALPPAAPAPAPAQTPEPDDNSYSGLYAKKSGKPLQQVYGHIERIGTGEVGSLLDRYSDRFGHELDRDIIVMRKDEREDKLTEIRDSPTVQLIGADAEEEESDLDSETLVELNSQLKTVENELRRLKPEYQAAKQDGDRDLLRELRPSLESLMAERKMIKAVIAGEADLEDLLAMGEEEEELEEVEYEDDADEAELEYEEDDEEDLFVEFVSIVDNLLGSNLPEDAISDFTKSDGFEVYRSVGSDPAAADDTQRAEFFSVVDTLLGGMPDEAVSSFVASDDFETYRAIGALYS